MRNAFRELKEQQTAAQFCSTSLASPAFPVNSFLLLHSCLLPRGYINHYIMTVTVFHFQLEMRKRPDLDFSFLFHLFNHRQPHPPNITQVYLPRDAQSQEEPTRTAGSTDVWRSADKSLLHLQRLKLKLSQDIVSHFK